MNIENERIADLPGHTFLPTTFQVSHAGIANRVIPPLPPGPGVPVPAPGAGPAPEVRNALRMAAHASQEMLTTGVVDLTVNAPEAKAKEQLRMFCNRRFARAAYMAEYMAEPKPKAQPAPDYVHWIPHELQGVAEKARAWENPAGAKPQAKVVTAFPYAKAPANPGGQLMVRNAAGCEVDAVQLRFAHLPQQNAPRAQLAGVRQLLGPRADVRERIQQAEARAMAAPKPGADAALAASNYLAAAGGLNAVPLVIRPGNPMPESPAVQLANPGANGSALQPSVADTIVMGDVNRIHEELRAANAFMAKAAAGAGAGGAAPPEVVPVTAFDQRVAAKPGAKGHVMDALLYSPQDSVRAVPIRMPFPKVMAADHEPIFFAVFRRTAIGGPKPKPQQRFGGW